ncbi:MAG: metallophosphoesterase [Clostridia bacterium]|nr:metallophosphoesterase [Clostridia bacterium]
MKKIISILLSVLMVVSCVSVGFAAEAEEPDLKFAVASDLHYNVPEEELTASGEIDDEIYWYANRRASMDNESGFIIDEFLNQCAENDDVDFVLVSGDIADNGKSIKQEHLDVAAKFKAFEEKTGKQIYVTIGNHDAGLNCETTYEDFKEIYHDFGYAEALTTVEENCSYTADLGDKYRLISLDSCDYDKSTEDGMTAEKLEWVHEQAKLAKADGRYPILMMHHNLLDHLPLQRLLSHDFIVRFHYTTATLFADWGIKLVFTGHEHCSDATSYTSPAGNKIYDFATTSLTMYPLQYRTFEITDKEINYAAQTVDTLDTNALSATVKGYSQEQLDLMNAGLNSYAKGYLKAGVQWRLTRSLKMEQIGIAEGEPFYNLVNTAVGGLRKILEQPLYGEGGIQELAKEYNLDIPDSEYETGWQVVTELVAAHYEGSENFHFESTEITIFLRLVALLLKDDLSTVTDEVFLEAANSILADLGTDSIVSDLTKLGTQIFGGVTPMEYFLLAAVSPLVHAFIVDDDGVDDNNGTLEGYGTVTTEGNVYNVADSIYGFFNKIAQMLSTVLSVLYKMIF